MILQFNLHIGETVRKEVLGISCADKNMGYAKLFQCVPVLRTGYTPDKQVWYDLMYPTLFHFRYHRMIRKLAWLLNCPLPSLVRQLPRASL
jgi:hypothetical protein